ncbi:restriction endonuclease, partial [Candidatus Saccharibacteria bacterium]|nr:restriction endonuclease [Candidatus Saccharibacteria bacterium]
MTNGTYLRLLRDATRLVRLSYLEFNLEKMMEEELYSEFAVFYRLLHASRMPGCPQQSEESIIEYYHQESLAAGTRIRERLSEAVEDAIKGLGNGLLQHPDNQPLREAISSGRLSPDQFYLHLLRLIYRLLFLMVI